MIADCDSKGRLYLREGIREKYGSRFVVVQKPGEILLFPVPKDPLKDLAEIGKRLPAKSIKKIRQEIRKQALKELG